jgi:hypothetical protein
MKRKKQRLSHHCKLITTRHIQSAPIYAPRSNAHNTRKLNGVNVNVKIKDNAVMQKQRQGAEGQINNGEARPEVPASVRP